MADVTITGLPNATTPLTGTERVPMDQAGVTVDAPVSAIVALAPATDLSYNAATRTVSSSTGADAVLPLADAANPGLLSAAGFNKLDSITVDVATLVRKYVRNNSGVPIPKGAPVYQTGSSGTTITVALADASTEATAAQTLGLAQEAIAHNSNGYVVAVGLLDGISTATLTEGQIFWLSETAGQLTTTRPTQPAHGVVCGYCVKQAAGTAGILYVKVDNGLELAELHDVLVTGAAAGQFLRLAADGLWQPRTFVAADISNSTTAGRALLTAADAAAQRSSLGLGTAATAASSDFATAAQGAKADTAIQPGNAALTDAREWSAETISQAEAEAGSATTRRAFTAQRVFQAIAAWWAASSAAAKLAGIAAGATANATDAQLRDRSTHTGTQAASTLSMSSQRIIGRSSAGTGGGEELSLTGLAVTGATLAPLTDLMIPLSDAAGTALTVGTREVIPYLQRTYVLTELPVWSVGTAPTGSALQLDIRVNGTSIYATLPTIAAGSTNSTSSPGAFSTAFVTGGQTIAAGSSVTFHVTQIGSTTAGAVLRVSIPVRRAS